MLCALHCALLPSKTNLSPRLLCVAEIGADLARRSESSHHWSSDRGEQSSTQANAQSSKGNPRHTATAVRRNNPGRRRKSERKRRKSGWHVFLSKYCKQSNSNLSLVDKVKLASVVWENMSEDKKVPFKNEADKQNER